jgi:hypothetical protein
VVEHSCVAADVAAPLELVDASLSGSRRQLHKSPDLASRTPSILDEETQDPMIDDIKIVSGHVTILTNRGLSTQKTLTHMLFL